MNGRASVRVAVYSDLATGLGDEPVDLAKTETGPMSNAFGSEKGLEYLGKYLIAHATAAVVNRNADTRSAGQLGASVGPKHGMSRLQRQPPPFGIASRALTDKLRMAASS